MKNQLKAINIQKTYGKRKVVKGISITVNQGEVVGLLGPNGAGKTTSFYMIVGLVRCDAGKVELNGLDITYEPIHKRARAGISYLPQEASIFRKLTVEENIMGVLELQKNLSKAERQEKLEQLLNEFSVTHLRHQFGVSLSGGERRRVEIARALAVNPQFILLDEPFAGVDPISVGDIRQLVDHLKNLGIGILITDHNVRETLSICQKAYIVGQGQIIAEGSPEEVLNNKKVREVYLGEEFDL